MTSFLRRLFVLVAATFAMNACQGGDSVCPTGWTPDAFSPGDCRATSAYVDGVHTRVGTGAYGFAIAITGNCQPGSGGDCRATLQPGMQVQAFAASAVPSTIACQFTPDVASAASATTDSSGRFEMSLPPGDYVLIATDPVDHCSVAEHATVQDGSDASVVFDFDHGAY